MRVVATRWKRVGECDESSDTILYECRRAQDDTVSSLSSTQCDTGSALTDEDVAEWHRNLPTGHVPGRRPPPTQTSDWLYRRWGIKKTKKLKRVSNLRAICSKVRGREWDQTVTFEVGTFIIRYDIHGICYRGRHFGLIFMTDIKETTKKQNI